MGGGNPILLVDTDTTIYEREHIGWLAHGAEIVHVESMSAAIEQLFHSGITFLFVAINADTIDWLPLMSVMRGHSIIPIFVLAERFTVPEQATALRAGADALASLSDNVEEGIDLALAYMQRLDAQQEQADRPLVWRDLVIDAAMHIATLRNNRLHLTPLGFSILRLLVLRRGRPMSKEAIFALGWPNNSSIMDVDGVVASQIHMIREELRKYTAPGDEYIGNVWGIGYGMV